MFRSIACLLFTTGFSASLFAQQGNGSIAGIVTDPQKAIIQGAQVSVRNTGTNNVFHTVSNDQGLYATPGITVGEYEVSVEAKGFRKSVRTGITLQVDQKAQIDFALEVGALADVVEVAGEAPLVDVSSATVGKVVEGRRIEELPLNGRNALALTLLTPGVKSNAGPTNSGFADRGTQISSISINGGPNSMNGQLLDGNTNILSFVGEVGVPPAVDAVEEFKVQSGAMSAEFGFTAGGIINLVTRSGTNQFHGTLYEFLRNDKFDARNTFAPIKNPLRYNQFGGSFGGPVFKNRTFFFGNYENYRLRQGSPVIASTPTAAQRNGDFSQLLDVRGNLIPIFNPATTRANPAGNGFVRDPFPGNVIPPALLDPVAQKVLQFYPLANRTPSDPFTNSNNFQRQGDAITNSDQYHVKIDHRFSDRNSIFGRYSFFRHQPFSTGFFADPVGNSRNDNVQNFNAVIADTETFSPSLINELRVGFSRQFFTFITASYGGGWPQKLGLPAIVPPDVMPTFAFGYTNLGNPTFGARGSINWEFTDMVTKIHGRHTLKFGAEYRILQGNNLQTSEPSGSFTFNALLTGNPQNQTGTGNGLASLVLGNVASAVGDRVLGQSAEGMATSFFLQDDWKITRRLTLNLGLRYDYQSQPVERNNGISNFDFTGRDPLGLLGQTVYAGVGGQPRTFRHNDYTDFGPRFGFAWDVFGSGHTVLRGGYAIFYPSIFYRDNFGSAAGFSSTVTNYVPTNPSLPAFQLSAGFPYPLTQPQGSKLGPDAFLGNNTNYVETVAKNPMSQQWDFSVQQQLPGHWLVDLTYSGNRGTHFNAAAWDANQLDPQYLSLGSALTNPVPNPYAGKVPGSLGAATISLAQSLKPFPYYNAINVFNPQLGAYSSNLFVASVERRMSKGVSLLLSYTSGKVISDSVHPPVDFGPIEQASEISFENGKYNRRLNRSVDPDDISQRAVLSILYELPFGKGRHWAPANVVIDRIVGGWQFNTIGVMQTGLPLIVRGATSTLGTANRPNSTGKSAKLGNPTQQKWFDTSQFINPPDYTFGNVARVLPDVRGPGTVNFDLSLIKNTRIKERWTLQFRAESFNFLNHVNLNQPNVTFAAGPNGTNVSGAFGVITAARDPRTDQFALKLIF